MPYGYAVRSVFMIIRSVRHRGLKRLIEKDDECGLRTDQVKRIRRVLTALVLAPDTDGILAPPGWRIHQLSGARTGVRSISISGNWRITFELEVDRYEPA